METMLPSQVSELVGLTMASVVLDSLDDRVVFTTSCGRVFHMHHVQECCEHVTIDEFDGEIDWLVGSPITMAEECSDTQETCTWTFYRFGSSKGHVSIKWYGTSNGYYSERVNFDEVCTLTTS